MKVATLLWALAIGTLVVILGAAVLLPSTKRGSIDLEEWRRRQEQAATQPASLPTTAPETQPAPGD